jgi:hypothetical protein
VSLTRIGYLPNNKSCCLVLPCFDLSRVLVLYWFFFVFLILSYLFLSFIALSLFGLVLVSHLPLMSCLVFHVFSCLVFCFFAFPCVPLSIPSPPVHTLQAKPCIVMPCVALFSLFMSCLAASFVLVSLDLLAFVSFLFSCVFG